MATWAPIRYAHNGDVAIAYTHVGEHARNLLVIGGFVGHLEIWPTFPPVARFADRLGSFTRVIMFDKRGTGLSDRGGEYILENIVDDALAVLDDLGVDHAAVLGISEGGAATTMMAATHPHRVDAMIQYGTYARVTEGPDYPEGVPVERMRALRERMLDNWGDSRSLLAWGPSYEGDAEALEWWGRLLRSGQSPGGVTAMFHAFEHIDVRPLLSSVRAPTLVMYRRGDRMVPPELSRTVARGIPEAREVELEGVDHLFFAGDQDALLDEIEEFVTGNLAARPADRVLATVLFTDIVGSTERAAQLGDRQWRDLLERHDRLARREVGRHRGRVIKTTGDGLLATFDGPARAVRAGASLRDAASKELNLELRVGIHTGECEAIGGDLGGIGVHIAARVQAAAGPGEVLVSSTVRDLVVGSGLQFEDRGEHELKGVPMHWRLFALSGDDEA